MLCSDDSNNVLLCASAPGNVLFCAGDFDNVLPVQAIQNQMVAKSMAERQAHLQANDSKGGTINRLLKILQVHK